jgi:acetyl esterase/lipase
VFNESCSPLNPAYNQAMQCSARNLAVSLTLLMMFAVGCEKPVPGPANNRIRINKPAPQAAPHPKESVEAASKLVEARKGFVTKLVKAGPQEDPPEAPPGSVFKLVKYPAQPGKLSAYLTPDPGDGKKHPAIIWITGGDCNSIGDVWSDYESDNEQSASAYRKEGLVMMFPSLRGGNDNPGRREGFLGEVEDVLAAADYLAALPYVDTTRIYLGGHSTGGTLVLLTAEVSARFRAVFSFGPVADSAYYGDRFVYCSLKNAKEMELRRPIRWLSEIKSPTFVFEGAEPPSNIDSLNEMKSAYASESVHFFAVPKKNHFSALEPVNRLIVSKILKDTGKTPTFFFTKSELARATGG